MSTGIRCEILISKIGNKKVMLLICEHALVNICCFRGKDGMEYAQEIPLPLPKQIVVFSLGSWKIFGENPSVLVGISLDATDTVEELGHIDSKNR